jgi:hypothetical protein
MISVSKWRPLKIVEQDHRAVKRITRPIHGFKTFVVRESC